MWIDGQLMLSEADVVKMCVVLVPTLWIAVVLLIGWIVEEVRNYRNRDLFKDFVQRRGSTGTVEAHDGRLTTAETQRIGMARQSKAGRGKAKRRLSKTKHSKGSAMFRNE